MMRANSASTLDCPPAARRLAKVVNDTAGNETKGCRVFFGGFWQI
jgi:hypothetical protein